jgi:uncharacterized membrane protein
LLKTENRKLKTVLLANYSQGLLFMQRVRKEIEIDAPIERVFHLFSDFENFPRWMSHIRDVHYSGRGYTRWRADAPLGTSVEWEAETVAFDPPYLIAWQSVRGDVDTEGEVTFRETRRGTTMMHVLLSYRPPAGRLGALVASLFGTNPEQQLEEDLERFAQVAERAQRRSLQHRRRRMDFDEEWDERLGQSRDEDEVDERPRYRYALTPRERERERREQRERRRDSDSPRETFRRGVDRLLDAPPRRRSRRS